ncbi:hypothetical protein MKX03_028152 [Papaver bracteatum]|nr:hypothetical protein MKX03_028152 [Papaver bracteatum]
MRDGVREQLRSKNTISASNSSHSKVMGLRNRTSGSSGVSDVEKLKEFHKWTDDSLIGDVLGYVSNDFSQASTVLQTVFSSDSSNQTGKAYTSDRSDPSQNMAEETKILVEECHGEPNVGKFSTKSNLYDITAPVNLSAAQHSQAASNAFLRGDHHSAQELSLRRRQKILSIRNHRNDVWKLDLHGLHASEAVHALKERLGGLRLSSHLLCIPIKLSNQKRCSPFDSVSFLRRNNIAETRGFTSYNRYLFDDTWPGVIAVRPKFRDHRLNKAVT